MIGGELKLESDRFYIHFPEQGDREISLIADQTQLSKNQVRH